MKLASVQVHRPTSVMEALQIQAEYADDSAFYAGGTELLLVMKLGLADYPHLIDLKHLPPLTELSVTGEEVCMGAAVSYLRILRDPQIGGAFPALVRMLAGIGNLRVRSTGTLGGNLAFADPHSDPLTFLVAAEATVVVAAADGSTRNIAVEELTIAPYTTALESGELVSTIRVPIPRPERRFVHEHIRFRERPALVITAAADVVDDRLVDMRLVVGAVEGVPRRIRPAEQLVERQGASGIDQVKEIVSEGIEPRDDLDGSSDYKRHLAGVYAARALRRLGLVERGE